MHQPVRNLTRSRVLNILGYPRDRAQVFVNGSEACEAIFRPTAAPVNITGKGRWSEAGGELLQLLVENMARLTFGKEMWDPKGIMGSVTIDGNTLTDFDVHNMEMSYETIAKLAYKPSTMLSTTTGIGPVFFRGHLEVSTVGDTYISLRGPQWRRGWVFVNGFSLGRYWVEVGPQLTMYVPSTLLHKGVNEFVILELHPAAALSTAGGPLLSFVDAQDFTGSPSVCSAVAPSASSPVQAFGCGEGGARQGWHLNQSSGLFQLAGSSLCLTGAAAPKDSNATATVAICDAADRAQQLQLTQSGLLVQKRRPALAALQLTSNKDGAQLIFGPAPTDPSAPSAATARWSAEETPLHVMHLINANGGRCISVCPKGNSQSALR